MTPSIPSVMSATSRPTNKISNYTATGVANPLGITNGPDRVLWFTDAYNPGSVGVITPNGKITVYTNSGFDEPFGITTGPDKVIWFTNYRGNSIGRITTSGYGRFFTGTGIDTPDSITTGPDGALSPARPIDRKDRACQSYLARLVLVYVSGSRSR